MASDTGNLFSRARERDPNLVPLAERMRPSTLEQLVGQSHLTAPGKLLPRIAASDRIPSMILWGPPGSGKTTIARLLAKTTGAYFETVSATDSGVKDLRRIVELARQRRDYEARATVLFVDEIHRFNKGQQDALLPHVESGVCVLVGATTENPSFDVNSALLSRARVLQLREIEPADLVEVLQRALADEKHGLGRRGLHIDDALLGAIAHAAQGDARRALGVLELSADLLSDDAHEITQEEVEQALGTKQLRYDKAGEHHYNVASALIKSMRASDPDAAVYWLARMIESGEDPMFVARRIVIFASEDVGNAEPQALVVANAAAQATHLVGLPEAVLPLTQAAIFCALAPKSNTVISSYFAARKELRERGTEPVPLEIRNAVTKLMKQSGYGSGYRYPHQFDEGVDAGHASHLPDAMREHLPGRRFVHSSDRGWEADAERELAARKESADADGEPKSE